MKSVLVVGTGLMGASVGLALKAGGFAGEVIGWDARAEELAEAQRRGAIDRKLAGREAVSETDADVVVLATPVLAILDWMERLAPALKPHQLVTDLGSTKAEIAARAQRLFGRPGRAEFLPGHPMAGKESGGAALAEATLFQNAVWLFAPPAGEPKAGERTAGERKAGEPESVKAWRETVKGFGARVREMDPRQHDEVCAWVSHLPQMLSTAISALLEDQFAADAEGMAAVQAIGGRALREITRLGSSPYSMWRDIALTNTEAIGAALWALEQRLAHVRENLRTPELREQFSRANRFRTSPRS